MELTDAQVGIMEDILNEFRDRLRHYPDAELGWDAEQVQAFNDLDAQHHAEAKKRKLWWAR
jgi:hypothetical protein